MPVVWWKWMRQGGMGQESCKSQEYIYRNVRRCLTSLFHAVCLAVQETLQDTLREREDGDEGGSGGFNMSMLVATKMTASPDGQEKGGGAGGETKVG